MQPPFFDPTDSGLMPRAGAHSPWSEDMMHGRLLAGLAAWAIERDHGEPEFQPVRLTVDLFRSPPMAPVALTTTLVRAGGRVRAVDASVHLGGSEVARASSLFLRRGEPPVESSPVTAPWDVEPPDEEAIATADASMPFEMVELAGHGLRASGPRQIWLREHSPLVAGVPLSPFVRAALAADFASPLANFGAESLDYINADLTLHLGRLPAGEWLGIATDDRVTADGVSVAQCVFYDGEGAVGWSSVCAVRTATMAP